MDLLWVFTLLTTVGSVRAKIYLKEEFSDQGKRELAMSLSVMRLFAEVIAYLGIRKLQCLIDTSCNFLDLIPSTLPNSKLFLQLTKQTRIRIDGYLQRTKAKRWASLLSARANSTATSRRTRVFKRPKTRVSTEYRPSSSPSATRENR